MVERLPRSTVLSVAAAVVVVVLVAVLGLTRVLTDRRNGDDGIITFLGDSYTAGSPMDNGFAARYPAIVADRLHKQPVVVAEPGAGWVQAGVTGERFPQEVDAVPPASEIVVVYGSRNDPLDGSLAREIERSAVGLLRAVQQRAPRAVVVVFGPSLVEDPEPVGAAQNAEAIRRACRTLGVEYVDTSEWLHDLPQGLIGSDTVHPTDAGHARLAAQMLPFIRRAAS